MKIFDSLVVIAVGALVERALNAGLSLHAFGQCGRVTPLLTNRVRLGNSKLGPDAHGCGTEAANTHSTRKFEDEPIDADEHENKV